MLKRLSVAGLLVGVLALAPMARAQDRETPKVRTVDVVFAIDCSGSMGSIIETAKQKIWTIVNTLAKETPKPVLRIGLFAYGNHDKNSRLYPLSDDLDTVYKNLMSFKDEGWGDEWVGWAIQQVTNSMDWTSSRDALKMVFVVGNETARQGPAELDYAKTAPLAIRKEIIVNAIYCGTPSPEEETTWKETARLADGSYVAIDQAGGAITINTPFDKDMGDLNTKLNGTYIYYGDSGKKGKENQEAQDDNSKSHGGASNYASRAEQKALSYDNSGWDLVDAEKNKDFKLSDVKKETLPKEYQSMSEEELTKAVEEKAKERSEIQAKIKELGEKRQGYIDEEMKKRKLDDSQSLDKNMKEMILKKMK